MIEYSNSDIYAIAKWQRILLWLIVISILIFLGLVVIHSFDIVMDIVCWTLAIIELVCLYQLLKSLKLNVIPWLIAFFVLSIIPILGLLFLLVIIQRATKAIKSKGLRVGIMGVSQKDIDLFISTSNNNLPQKDIQS